MQNKDESEVELSLIILKYYESSNNIAKDGFHRFDTLWIRQLRFESSSPSQAFQ